MTEKSWMVYRMHEDCTFYGKCQGRVNKIKSSAYGIWKHGLNPSLICIYLICNLDWKISQQCLQSGIWRLTSNKSGCYIVRINLGHRTLLSSICASLCLVINTFLVNLTSLFYLKQIWTLLYSRILMNAATHTSYLMFNAYYGHVYIVHLNKVGISD